MKKQERNLGKDIPTQEEEQVLADIMRIRDSRQPDRGRVESFDQTANASDGHQPINATLTAIHPDGMTTITVTSTEELAQGLAALYSDGHGDFGQYGFMRDSHDKEEAAPRIESGVQEKNDPER